MRFLRKVIIALYRSLQRLVVEPLILPFVFSSQRKMAGRQDCRAVFSLERKSIDVGSLDRVWFHAASVGELESLTPVIESFSRRDNAEVIVTILSESARGALDKLRASLGGKIVFSGYAPWEGRWGEALRVLQPRLLITAKYEAWPELWVRLSQQAIPLAIVGARPRRSLKVARLLCMWMSGKLPEIVFFTALAGESNGLRALFPKSRIEQVGEPRWDRVRARLESAALGSAANRRVSALAEQAALMARPWGILAQVWPQDMGLLVGPHQGSGTLWVVPHKIDEAHVRVIEERLRQAKYEVVRSSSRVLTVERTNCVLVDEMGFLAELYSHMDWAYVGGGFGAGVHSTIEPALRGLAIAAGPAGADRFSEVEELLASGQLTLVHSSQDFARWLEIKVGQKEKWLAQASARCGATNKILSVLDSVIH